MSFGLIFVSKISFESAGTISTAGSPAFRTPPCVETKTRLTTPSMGLFKILRSDLSAATITACSSCENSDLALAKEFADTLSVGLLTQVNPMPTGVMLFKREPPAKYRAYATNNKMSSDFKESFVAYLERTPDVKPSSLFKNSFTRRYNYLWDKYYVDYDDEKNLMMMMLMFPGLIGKKYKLEKK